MWDTYKERKKIGKSTKFISEGKEVPTQKLSRWLKDNGKVPSPTASPGVKTIRRYPIKYVRPLRRCSVVQCQYLVN